MAQPRKFNPVLHQMRGWAIFLVVLGHSMSALYAFPSMVDASRFVYAFHMELFVFISGFVGRRIFAPEPGSYTSTLVRQFKRLMSVYFFYTVIGIAAKLILSRHVNNPIVWRDDLAGIFLYPRQNPYEILWFIYMLFVMQVIFLTIHTWLPTDYRKGWHVLVGFGVVLAAALARPWLPGMMFGLHLVFSYALYYFLGYVAGVHAERIEPFIHRWKWPLAAGCAAYYAWAVSDVTVLERTHLLKMLSSAVGILASWWLAAVVFVRLPAVKAFFDLLGTHAYTIYLNGSLVQRAVRISLASVLGLAAVVVFAVELLAGLFVPVLLELGIYRRSRWLRGFALGDWSDKSTAATPAPETPPRQ